MCDQLAAVPPVMAAPIPMLTASSTSSVQYVERTERILVNSERSVPPKPARPDGGGRTGGRAGWVVVAAMSDLPFVAVLPMRGLALRSELRGGLALWQLARLGRL